MRFLSFISFLVVWWALASGCWQDVGQHVAATIFSTHGQVVFRMEGQGNFQPVTPATRLGVGSTVRTLDNGQLNLGLLPSALLQLSSNSEIKIEELKISKDGNETGDAMRERGGRIGLNRGRIIFLFNPRGKTAQQFTISAPPAAITPDADCLFCVNNDGTRVRVTCVRGKVYVSHNAEPLTPIDAGYFQQWPSPRAKPAAASEDAAAQIDIADALEIENQLLGSQSEWQKRRPF